MIDDIASEVKSNISMVGSSITDAVIDFLTLPLKLPEKMMEALTGKTGANMPLLPPLPEIPGLPKPPKFPIPEFMKGGQGQGQVSALVPEYEEEEYTSV